MAKSEILYQNPITADRQAQVQFIKEILYFQFARILWKIHKIQ